MLLLTLLLLAPADAGRRRRQEPAPAPAPPPPPPLDDTAWFPSALIFPLGPLPSGLGNATAAGCAACHPTSHAAWQRGGHGSPPSSSLLAAAAADPSCTACHLPLVEQRDRSGSFGFGDEQPPWQPQPFSATLWSEGVGCAACHVREGTILGPRHLDDGAAPHPVRGSSTLGSAEGCATCHQLEVEGVVWYDTFSSWRSSPYAEAGIGCTDCHGSRAPHGQAVGPGVSLLVDLPTRDLTRGGEPTDVTVVVQNTGAGHSWPSTGPHTGAELVARLVATDPERGVPIEASRFTAPLIRTLDRDGNPGTDTRIPPMGEARFTVPIALTQDHPAGPWHLEVIVQKVILTDPTPAEAPVVAPMTGASPRLWLPLDVD